LAPRDISPQSGGLGQVFERPPPGAPATAAVLTAKGPEALSLTAHVAVGVAAGGTASFRLPPPPLGKASRLLVVPNVTGRPPAATGIATAPVGALADIFAAAAFPAAAEIAGHSRRAAVAPPFQGGAAPVTAGAAVTSTISGWCCSCCCRGTVAPPFQGGAAPSAVGALLLHHIRVVLLLPLSGTVAPPFQGGAAPAAVGALLLHHFRVVLLLLLSGTAAPPFQGGAAPAAAGAPLLHHFRGGPAAAVAPAAVGELLLHRHLGWRCPCCFIGPR
jgi:hypothetical protein